MKSLRYLNPLACLLAAALMTPPAIAQEDVAKPASDAARPNLIRNGDFEAAVPHEETRYAPGWTFETPTIAQHWEYHNQAGLAAMVDSSPSSSGKAIRIKSKDGKMAIIHQKLALTDAGRIDFSAKIRGAGSIEIATFQYDRETSKYIGTPTVIPETPVFTQEWGTVKATFGYEGKTMVYIALFIKSDEGVEIDDVKLHYAPRE